MTDPWADLEGSPRQKDRGGDLTNLSDWDFADDEQDFAVCSAAIWFCECLKVFASGVREARGSVRPLGSIERYSGEQTVLLNSGHPVRVFFS